MNTTVDPNVGTSSERAFPEKKKHGCFFYGCLTTIVLGILFAAGIYFGLRHLISSTLENYSTTAPLTLPMVSVTDDRAKEVVSRADAFFDGLTEESGPKELKLTSEEANILINRYPELHGLRDHVYVSTKDSRLVTQLSYPLDKFGFPGRFFNGEGVLLVKMEGGVLEASIESLIVKGVPVPQKIIEGLSGKNLAAELYEKQESLAIIKRLKSVRITDEGIGITRN